MSPTTPPSDARLRANRANSQKSTGPRSDSGKQRARLNACRHGLTGRTVLLPAEEFEVYRAHSKALTASLAPEGPEETLLAAAIADDYWRLERLRSIEEGILALQFAQPGPPRATRPDADAALAQAQAFLDHAPRLQLISLYEQRLNRGIRTKTARLAELQAARREALARALEEAKLLLRLARHENRAYDPAPDFPGFVFSTPEVAAAVHREDRLAAARSVPRPLAKAA